MSKLRVYVADDHPIVRNGLKGLIDSQEDMEVVGESWEGAAAIRDIHDTQPDVVLMDISMPGVGGAEATEQIRSDCPNVKVLALTAHEDRGYLQLMLKSGASGYVLKRAAADDLVRAIRTVAAGETYIDPAVAGQLVNTAVRSTTFGTPQNDLPLSDREEAVIRLIAQGHPIKQIASRLNIGVRTVETYRSRGMEKLALRSRSDVVRYAAHRGWLTIG
jgi:DNA-binding NarL/FixJ family response regulator